MMAHWLFTAGSYLRQMAQVEHKIQSAEVGEGFHLELQKACPPPLGPLH